MPENTDSILDSVVAPTPPTAATLPTAAIPSTTPTQPTAPAGSDYAFDVQNEVQRSSVAFDDLLAEYRQLSDSQRAKGNLFEQLVRSYLEKDAEMSRQWQRKTDDAEDDYHTELDHLRNESDEYLDNTLSALITSNIRSELFTINWEVQ